MSVPIRIIIEEPRQSRREILRDIEERFEEIDRLLKARDENLRAMASVRFQTRPRNEKKGG